MNTRRLTACGSCGEPTLPEYDLCCCCDARCDQFPKVPEAYLELCPPDGTAPPPPPVATIAAHSGPRAPGTHHHRGDGTPRPPAGAAPATQRA